MVFFTNIVLYSIFISRCNSRCKTESLILLLRNCINPFYPISSREEKLPRFSISNIPFKGIAGPCKYARCNMVDAHPSASRQETLTYQSVKRRLVVSEEGSMEEVDGKLIEVVRQVRKKESSILLCAWMRFERRSETQQSIDNK